MRSAITLFLTLFISTICFAQKETNHWFLTDQNWIKFNPGGGVSNQPPPNVMFGAGSAASIADTAGNLLFFATGFMVYDKNKNPMSSYSNPFLLGNSELKIAPVPNQPTKYYLFYINQQAFPGNKTLKYSIIDMSLNGGLGDVVARYTC